MDSMKKCKHCGSEISDDAKICPNCKKRQKIAWWQIVLIVFVAIIVLSMITTGDKENTSSNESDKTSTNQTTNNSKVEEKDSYIVGEIFKNNSISIAYESLNDNFTNYSSYATIKDGCKIISASFEFENVSNSDKVVSSYDFNCYADGYDCESFWSTEDSSFSANLSSGKKAKGTVYFQVPQDSNNIVIEYEDNIFSNKKVKFIVK